MYLYGFKYMLYHCLLNKLSTLNAFGRNHKISLMISLKEFISFDLSLKKFIDFLVLRKFPQMWEYWC